MAMTAEPSTFKFDSREQSIQPLAILQSRKSVFDKQNPLDKTPTSDTGDLHAPPSEPQPSRQPRSTAQEATLIAPSASPTTYMGHEYGDAQSKRAAPPGSPAHGTTSSSTAAATPGPGPGPGPVPQIELETPSTAGPSPKDTVKRWLPIPSAKSPVDTSPSATSFHSLSLDFPAKGLSEEIGTNNLNFSARGSMLIDGKKLNGFDGSPGIIHPKTMPVVREPVRRDAEKLLPARKRAVSTIAERPQTRYMSNDEEALAEKVRAFYALGTDSNDTSIKRTSLHWRDALQEHRDSTISTSRGTSTTDLSNLPPSPTIQRDDLELAGGVEDWQDVDNADVDRYGFIAPKSPTTLPDDAINAGIKRAPTTSGQGLQRVSTSLQLAAETPRRKHTIRRTPSNARSTRSDYQPRRTPSQASFHSSKSANVQRHYSTSRILANRLPHNKERRLMDEASDMLTLPRSATSNTLARTLTDDSASTTPGTYTPSSTPQSRRRELDRQEKWRKMAHDLPAKPGTLGGGMIFAFDTLSPKLIERTWKGIPDTWRSAAWWCFLSDSAKRHNKRYPHKPCLSDDVLIQMFHEYQDVNSPDDVQIDIDVPRTISSHIMFRRRYRGGQRLLFRVLHALSMHFADVGYVQGMAALAATFLAYYEEEKAFVMLVRLWELRGLEKLYKHGFGGLMEALDDFEQRWLGQGELRKKLDDLMIGPTAYGTKWYLTLFNYSIPFPSQLRVWDVFLLLGDDDYDMEQRAKTPVPKTADTASNTNGNTTNNNGEKDEEKANFGTTLDVLHATSAALIDSMRAILLESDFENAMKVLTSWVPIMDEDLFMRVARAEWKMHQQRRKKS